jgi:POT family proton-dependent oligopeptide transporter
MNASDPIDVAEEAKSRAISHDVAISEKHPEIEPAPVKSVSSAHDEDDALQKIYPNEEDLRSLRRVAGKIPWTTFTVAFVELCERFSYYGTTAVCTFTAYPTVRPSNQKSSRKLHPASPAGQLLHRCPHGRC